MTYLIMKLPNELNSQTDIHATYVVMYGYIGSTSRPECTNFERSNLSGENNSARYKNMRIDILSIMLMMKKKKMIMMIMLMRAMALLIGIKFL